MYYYSYGWYRATVLLKLPGAPPESELLTSIDLFCDASRIRSAEVLSFSVFVESVLETCTISPFTGAGSTQRVGMARSPENRPGKYESNERKTPGRSQYTVSARAGAAGLRGEGRRLSIGSYGWGVANRVRVEPIGEMKGRPRPPPRGRGRP